MNSASSLLDFLLRNGYWVLFGTVLAEQVGLPIPSVLVLLGMGALVGTGDFSLRKCLRLAVAACLVSDTTWYWLGRTRGQSMLKTLCKISVEQDTCVSSVKDWFTWPVAGSSFLGVRTDGF